jgi:hypothetical protein
MLEYAPHGESRTGPVARRPGSEPVGVEGCPTCQIQAESRAMAREVGAPTTVTYRNAEIANHPHRAPVAFRLPLTAVGAAV